VVLLKKFSITCHKHGTMGVDVGPPRSDVKVKPPKKGLLSDIFSEVWVSWSRPGAENPLDR
jgi:hypothetical protein